MRTKGEHRAGTASQKAWKPAKRRPSLIQSAEPPEQFYRKMVKRVDVREILKRLATD
jgi:hypothetical protein